MAREGCSPFQEEPATGRFFRDKPTTSIEWLEALFLRVKWAKPSSDHKANPGRRALEAAWVARPWGCCRHSGALRCGVGVFCPGAACAPRSDSPVLPGPGRSAAPPGRLLSLFRVGPAGRVCFGVRSCRSVCAQEPGPPVCGAKWGAGTVAFTPYPGTLVVAAQGTSSLQWVRKYRPSPCRRSAAPWTGPLSVAARFGLGLPVGWTGLLP